MKCDEIDTLIDKYMCALDTLTEVAEMADAGYDDTNHPMFGAIIQRVHECMMTIKGMCEC